MLFQMLIIAKILRKIFSQEIVCWFGIRLIHFLRLLLVFKYLMHGFAKLFNNTSKFVVL